ncbi:hypothetical protein Trco_002923 [Trichoderma cornu-damae]|uniref:Uncharacterized protein n=1 Tax=Trichoderma cornu-damae TaxID=654480 RepID=A0A9P8TZ00_9HYPO|nr:hypothetical protein Trco_002923 [Trichoderma cornu-damae]
MSPGRYSHFVSITKESTTAERLVASSPLTYKIAEPARSAVEDIYVADLDEPESFSAIRPTVTGEQASIAGPRDHERGQGREEGPRQGQREFKLDIFPAPEYNHRFAMSGSPLHSSWPEACEQDQSFMAATLKESLPKNIASKGLVHWLVSLGGAMRMERKAKRLRLKRWLPSNMKKEEHD